MWKFHRPLLIGHPGHYQPQSDVLGLWSSNEKLLRAFQWKRSGGLVTLSCLKAGCFSGSRSRTKRACRASAGSSLWLRSMMKADEVRRLCSCPVCGKLGDERLMVRAGPMQCLAHDRCVYDQLGEGILNLPQEGECPTFRCLAPNPEAKPRNLCCDRNLKVSTALL